MRKYLRLFKPDKRRAVIFISTKNLKDSKELIAGIKTEADDYFHEKETMEEDNIIACVDLRRETLQGRRVYYPYGTFVHPDFRKQGLGIALYKACLMVIKYKMDKWNRDDPPLFVQHGVAEPGDGSTSESAKRIYNSLVKQGYISKVSNGTYNIKKFPQLNYRIIE